MNEIVKRPALPELKELLAGDMELRADQNDLNVYLNTTPPDGWIKKHPIVSNVKYLPIERIEWLLTRIFFRWYIEIVESKIVANSITVTVRLFYLDRLSDSGNYLHQDGVGAAPLQTDKGAGAIEFDKIKNDAVMKALPAAESYAIKDAAEKIGRLFGKDLNRKDDIGYDILSGQIERETKHEEIFSEIK
jgi:hypothetical protein